MEKEKIMKDGTTGYLTQSRRYYVRQEKSPKHGDSILYFTLEGDRIPLASATCPECGTVMQSKMCGHFVSCSCGKSFVDTDRWMPERHRYGGLVVSVAESK